jgi:EAL domain-containing protein (putative c-di-GMP-specific phosphodiesterase class I)
LDFIPVAEELGLVDKVDVCVFKKAAKFIAYIIKEKGANLTLCVNVSVRHLMKNNFIDELREVLAESGLAPDNLEIEITESIMIDSADKALACIKQVKAMGDKVAIDDFGTGYSSLSYLNKFPADMLKIDKSFIDVMNSSESSKQYVATIISIGHILNLKVISEGVETEDQLDTLRQIGCDYVQGYIWGRPLDPQDAAALV